MKSRGGQVFKSTGGAAIAASQSVVELPPISKNGLILEDADDVDYSLSSAKGGRRKPLLHANSADRISAPRIVNRGSNKGLASSNWSTASNQNSVKTRTRQVRTVEALPLGRNKSSPSIDSSHVVSSQPGSVKKQTSEQVSHSKQLQHQSGTSSLSDKVPTNDEHPHSTRTLSADTSSSTSLQNNGKENTNANSAKTQSMSTKSTNPSATTNRGASESTRNEKLISKETCASVTSSLSDARRAKTAGRRRKMNQNDDFVIEMFLKDKPPLKTVINEKFTRDQLNDRKAALRNEPPANAKCSASVSNGEVIDDEALSGAGVSYVASEIACRKENSEESSLSEKKEPEELEKNTDENVPSADSVVVAPPVVRTASKYHEDVISPPEDVFITGCNLRSPKFEATPISVQEAISLKKVLFGDTHAVWSKSWLNHSLNMSGSFSLDLCHFGPSGLLAALQAYYLQQHFFANEKDETNLWKPTQAQKRANLLKAIASLLWKCGSDHSLACFCNVSSHVQYSSSSAMPHDGVTERVEIFRFNSETEVSQFASEFANQILSSKCALLALLYSVVLSRSPYSIRQDLLNQEEPLLVNYRCTPALIALLLTGVAAPSWVNDNSDLRLDPRFRRGISSRSNLGVLTTRRKPRHANNPYSVESNLKTPKLPIWVAEIPSGDIYSGRNNWQYSVLFCPNKRLVSDWKVERHFDLYWTQACPYQVEKVKFTLDARAVVNWDEFAEEDFHWIETAIRTKWIDLDVDWNGLDRGDFGFVQPSETAVQVFKK